MTKTYWSYDIKDSSSRDYQYLVGLFKALSFKVTSVTNTEIKGYSLNEDIPEGAVKSDNKP